MVETFTAGQIAARIAHLPGAEHVFRRGIVVRHLAELHNVFGLDRLELAGEMTEDTTIAVAAAAREQTGATHALVVLIDLDDGADRIDFGGTIWIGIADRHADRIPPLAHSGRARMGASRRGRTGPRLPAPASCRACPWSNGSTSRRT